jgi:predicted permease
MKLWWLWRKRERELEKEIQHHLQMGEAERLERGTSVGDARTAARREFGNVSLVKEVTRDSWGWRWLADLLADVRFGLRMLRKSPVFAATAILTLALGIGANATIFSVVQGVLLAPLPYREPNRLVTVWLYNFRLKSPTDLSYRDFMDWERAAPPFEKMSAYAWRSFDLSSPGNPEHLDGREISSDFLSTLGVRLALGREFSADEDRNGGVPVAIISNGLWRDRFGGSATALGKSIVLDGVETTVVGVLRPGFRFGTDYADVYIPIGQRKLVDANDRTVHDVACVARLKRGVSLSQADAEMNALQGNIDRLNPEIEQGLGARILPAKELLVGDVRGTLLLLFGAVGVVLLIACANVANLLLARSAARAREFSIRAALGASRWRIMRQLVTESILLSVLGGVLGLLAATWALNGALATLAVELPRSDNIHLNASVLFFALGISIVVGILFGLAPALRSSKADLQPSLKEGGRGSTGGHHRTQSGLVIVQMALTLVLLSGAGLLLRTMQHLWKADLGFESEHVLTFQLGLSPSATKTGAGVRAAYHQLLDRIRQIPGVQGAEITTEVPMTHQINSVPFWVDSHRPASVAEAPRTLGFITGPDFLQVMRIPLIRGRFISQQDTINSPLVAVIDSELARTYFPGTDPIGRTITFPQVGDYRIIGIVGHVQHWQVGFSSPFMRNQSYVSIYQVQDRWMTTIDTWTWVVVRTPLDASIVLPEIRKAVYRAASDQTVYHAQTMAEIVSESMSPQRFLLILLGSFATLALLLASIGIYGVMSYSVMQRVHEIGIRMALGAMRGDILRLVMGFGTRLVILGIGAGTVGALALTRLMTGLLFEVSPSDPLTFSIVAALLTLVSLVACYIPTRRAMRVDPVMALRYE